MKKADVCVPYAKKFDELMQKETTPEEWLAFWQKSVKNFDQILTKTLQDFGKELEVIFAK